MSSRERSRTQVLQPMFNVNHRLFHSLILLLAVLCLLPSGRAAELSSSNTNQPVASATESDPFDLGFANRGTIPKSSKSSGGARGNGASLTVLEALTPPGVGLTTEESPTLYWYQSAPVDVPFELAIVVSDHPQEKIF